jgi:tRNA A-37 threonylcarbamoyl transferase component Bud32
MTTANVIDEEGNEIRLIDFGLSKHILIFHDDEKSDTL